MLKEQIERSFLMGIGLLSLTREKARAFAEEMVKQGEAARDEVSELTDRLVERGEEERRVFRKMIREEVDKAMKDVRVATATDVEKLESRMEMLEARLETHSHDEEAGESGA
jgi:polyhydroxyalkanoate synthesis regulator phasin